MALPAQGGLGQVSQPRPPAPPPVAFDVSSKEAELIESQAKPGLKNTVMSDLGDQREALNKALLQMRQSLEDRKSVV